MSFYNNTTLLHAEPIQGTVVNSDYDLTIGVLPHDDISSYGAFFEDNAQYRSFSYLEQSSGCK